MRTDMNIKMVDLYGQYLGIRDEIDRAMAEVVESSSFIKGPAVEQLEAGLCSFLGVRHCIACGSGTDALTLSMMAAGIGQGDEVIMPAFSFAAVAEAVALLGARPVFADVEASTFNLDISSMERMISPRTKAVVPVHLFGQPCDMEKIMDVAKRHGLIVIEDNAQSLGALCRFSDGSGRHAGSIGHLGCTSFFPSKVLGCFGDGGAVFTDDEHLASMVRSLANHGQSIKYHHEHVGLNSRLDSLQAAVLNAKLPHLESWITARRQAAEYYSEGLRDLGQVCLPVVSPDGTHVWHQYTLRVPQECRDGLKEMLAGAGIPSMVYYPAPLYGQPAYRDLCSSDTLMENAGKLCGEVLSLPMHSELSRAQQDEIIGVIRRYFTEK